MAPVLGVGSACTPEADAPRVCTYGMAWASLPVPVWGLGDDSACTPHDRPREACTCGKALVSASPRALAWTSHDSVCIVDASCASAPRRPCKAMAVARALLHAIRDMLVSTPGFQRTVCRQNLRRRCDIPCKPLNSERIWPHTRGHHPCSRNRVLVRYEVCDGIPGAADDVGFRTSCGTRGRR